MNYPPPQGHGPYPPQQGGPYPPQGRGYPPQPPYDEHYEERRRREENSDRVANIVRVVLGVVLTIFLLHVLFVVFDANQGNEFVSVVYVLAKTLVLGLGDVFTPDDALLGVVLNYGLAALVYLVIGQLVIKSLRR
ncbi:hypothetical protein [Saccharopolyspora rhizosphaerae]|uniref:hypothetical protein n=1 Tax=Saccharopolyspora rhizosphaerae TaxID=2492662 RepID=UPI001F448141|nr:hypothetical protein [Saccharopolyspora rhizosphaerae]